MELDKYLANQRILLEGPDQRVFKVVRLDHSLEEGHGLASLSLSRQLIETCDFHQGPEIAFKNPPKTT